MTLLNHRLGLRSGLSTHENVLHCSTTFIFPTRTPSLSSALRRSEEWSWAGLMRGGAAMMWRSPAGWGPSSSSSSSSSRCRAYRRSTGCRARPAGGAARSPARWCWPPPGYPPPEGQHDIFKSCINRYKQRMKWVWNVTATPFSDECQERFFFPPSFSSLFGS